MNRFRLALAGAAAVLVAAAVSAARSGEPPPLVLEAPTRAPVLGIAPAPPYSAALVRLDPLTLKRVGRRYVVLGEHGFGWSFSPDRSRLVLGDGNGDLLLVDTRRLRALGHVDVAGGLRATQWLSRSRLVAVVGSCCTTTLVEVDAAARRVVSRRALDGALVAATHLPRGLVLLLGPRSGVGRSRLAVVDGRGGVRIAEVDRIPSGQEPISEERTIARYAAPALAVDAAAGRAFVLGAAPEAAELDLDTMRVAYHSTGRPVSVAARLRDWLEPAAGAKGVLSGSTRTALPLGGGILAVFGRDDRGYLDAKGRPQQESTPSGLELVDTRDWSVRMLDPSADVALVARGALLATGTSWRSEEQRTTGGGLRIFGPDRRLRAHLYGTRPLWFEALGGRAFVPFRRPVGYRIVDVGTGQVVASVPTRVLPRVLDEHPFPY